MLAALALDEPPLASSVAVPLESVELAPVELAPVEVEALASLEVAVSLLPDEPTPVDGPAVVAPAEPPSSSPSDAVTKHADSAITRNPRVAGRIRRPRFRHRSDGLTPARRLGSIVDVNERGRNDTVQWRRIRARVVGVVQGVSFRASAQANATSLGLSGFVRNEADGSVTLEIEGDQNKVEAMVEWCRQGPPGARVDDVVVLKLPPTLVRAPFSIST